MSHKIADLLVEIKSSNYHVMNLNLISVDGLMIASSFVGCDEGIDSLRTAVLVSIGKKLSKQWGIGNLNEITISTQDYIYLVKPLTKDYFA